MTKIHIEIETSYDKGDVVIFEKNDILQVGIIEGYYVDSSAGNTLWYNIRVNPDTVYTYSSGGDIAEWDIKQKLDDNEALYNFISGKESE